MVLTGGNHERKKTDKREIISDTLLTVGGVLLSVGVGMIDLACGVIAAGVISIIYGGLIARGGNE